MKRYPMSCVVCNRTDFVYMAFPPRGGIVNGARCSACVGSGNMNDKSYHKARKLQSTAIKKKSGSGMVFR